MLGFDFNHNQRKWLSYFEKHGLVIQKNKTVSFSSEYRNWYLTFKSISSTHREIVTLNPFKQSDQISQWMSTSSVRGEFRPLAGLLLSGSW